MFCLEPRAAPFGGTTVTLLGRAIREAAEGGVNFDGERAFRNSALPLSI